MSDAPRPVRLQPGPVAVSAAVRAARERPRVNHRSPRFAAALAAVRDGLTRLTGTRHVALLVGTGTLANDAVAAQLACLGGEGLVLVTGEFGRRLVDHARGAGLAFEVLERPWDRGLDAAALDEAFAASPRWVWAAHLETSTGALADVADLTRRCRAAGAALALDGVSAVGSVEVDYAAVDWVSTVSGKGLAAYPGLAMVLARAPFLEPGERPVPPVLDLARHQRAGGVPSTVPSELVEALGASLEELVAAPPWPRRRQQASRLRERLEAAGLAVLHPPGPVAPAVTTVALPAGTDGQALGRQLEEAGVYLHYASGYLRDRGWLQLCLMGEVADADLDRAADALAGAVTSGRAASG